jgi:hypothetical protein
MRRILAQHTVSRRFRPGRPKTACSSLRFAGMGTGPAGGLAWKRDVSLGRHAGRLNLPRYFITWSGHVQACVQGWPSRNCGVFPAVDHDRSRT